MNIHPLHDYKTVGSTSVNRWGCTRDNRLFVIYQSNPDVAYVYGGVPGIYNFFCRVLASTKSVGKTANLFKNYFEVQDIFMVR